VFGFDVVGDVGVVLVARKALLQPLLAGGSWAYASSDDDSTGRVCAGLQAAFES
jgi:hypothetical protein